MLKAFPFPLWLRTGCEKNLNNNFVLHLFKSSTSDVTSDYYSFHECMCVTLHNVIFLFIFQFFSIRDNLTWAEHCQLGLVWS